MQSYSILQTTGDTKINIDLSNNFSRVDKGEDITNYINKEVKSKIDAFYDSEVVMLKHNLSTGYKIQLDLYNITTSSYQKDFSVLFTETELKRYKPVFSNSLLIYEFYDSINSDKNTKLGVSYIFNYSRGRNSNDVNSYGYYGSTIYDINQDYTKNIIINKEILNKQTFIYAKLSFFNAKTGKLIRLYNPYKESSITEEKLYYKLLIDKTNYTYQFDTSELNGFYNSNYLFPFKELISGTPETPQNSAQPQSNLTPGGLNNGGNGNSDLDNKGVIIC